MKDLVKSRVKAEWYFSLTPEERLARNLPTNDKNIAKYVGVTSVTICSWRKQWTEKKNPKKSLSSLSQQEKVEQFDNLLYELANDPKSSSKYKELFARRHGLLVDKSEQKVTFTIDAEEHFRIREEARRRVSEANRGTDGAGSLLTEPTLLPTKIREDTGQD